MFSRLTWVRSGWTCAVAERLAELSWEAADREVADAEAVDAEEYGAEADAGPGEPAGRMESEGS